MALDKLVDSTQLDSDLTSVANAIRAKSGGSSQLAFPAGFVSEIGNIPSGGYSLDEICTPKFPAASGDIVYTGTRVRPFLFYENTTLKSFIGNNVTTLSGSGFCIGNNVCTFQKCTSLEYVSLMGMTSFNGCNSAFSGCTSLKTVDVDWANLVSLGSYLFQNCPALTKQYYVLPKLNTNIWAEVLTKNTHVIGFDVGKSTTSNYNLTIRSKAFSNDSSLNLLILRGATTYIRSLDNIDAFEGTPFASNGAGGTLYVPSASISAYQSATNWSTILGYANNQIKAIEGSYYETHYADGTTIST